MRLPVLFNIVDWRLEVDTAGSEHVSESHLLRRGDGEHETLSAMAVYRFTFRPPTASEWSKVLHGDVSALDVAVTERRLVGLGRNRLLGIFMPNLQVIRDRCIRSRSPESTRYLLDYCLPD